ncbi:MAG: hypothetical protein ACXAB7_16560 [Candidatus Kariarchaeaceae archaeon]|jgi:hypothetical protein
MSEYQFTDDENRLFFRLSQKLVFLATSLLLTGVLLIILGFIYDYNYTNVASGVVFILFAFFLLGPIQQIQDSVISGENNVRGWLEKLKTMNTNIIIIIVVIAAIGISSFVEILDNI